MNRFETFVMRETLEQWNNLIQAEYERAEREDNPSQWALGTLSNLLSDMVSNSRDGNSKSGDILRMEVKQIKN